MNLINAEARGWRCSLTTASTSMLSEPKNTGFVCCIATTPAHLLLSDNCHMMACINQL